MATYTNQTKNVSSFSNAAKSNATVFGELTFDQVGSYTFDGLFNGRPIGDWAFDDLVGDLWANNSKN